MGKRKAPDTNVEKKKNGKKSKPNVAITEESLRNLELKYNRKRKVLLDRLEALGADGLYPMLEKILKDAKADPGVHFVCNLHGLNNQCFKSKPNTSVMSSGYAQVASFVYEHFTVQRGYATHRFETKFLTRLEVDKRTYDFKDNGITEQTTERHNYDYYVNDKVVPPKPSKTDTLVETEEGWIATSDKSVDALILFLNK